MSSWHSSGSELDCDDSTRMRKIGAKMILLLPTRMNKAGLSNHSCNKYTAIKPNCMIWSLMMAQETLYSNCVSQVSCLQHYSIICISLMRFSSQRSRRKQSGRGPGKRLHVPLFWSCKNSCLWYCNNSTTTWVMVNKLYSIRTVHVTSSGRHKY